MSRSTLYPGEIHALLGENGAGKSTLIKIMTGIQQPDTGEILLDGQPVHVASSQDAQRLRHCRDVPGADDLPRSLGGGEHLHRAPQPGQDRRPAAGWNAKRDEVLARLGVQLDVGEPARGLTLAEQQTVEIAKAISLDVRVLIMDEPTASLSAHEVRQLFRIIDNLREQGVAILFISHRMDEVFEIADRVTILRDGHWISHHAARRADPGAWRSAAWSGGKVVEIFQPRAARAGRCAAHGRRI